MKSADDDHHSPSPRTDSPPDQRRSIDEPPETDGTPQLESSRQRAAVRFLLAANGPVKMGTIAEYVAADEQGTTVDQLETEQRLEAYVPLFQSFLPKLAQFGMVEYDQSRGIVYPTDRLEEIEPQLNAASRKRAVITSV
ncbi:DUF7344 domain-containing protein [Natronosalvus vescus]|uniref:DUF7344 domain-containing protein n=1 Tax=Natronosalvus vescus TaxID=2953881 RepID=UPI0020905102|nr:hypothetical protein [Natronosalvus vescus]